MREPSPRRWQTWRVTPTRRPLPGPNTPDALLKRMAHTTPDRGSSRNDPPAVPPELKAEAPGPDGVRHGLVAHVRRLIAAGEYDTPERWEAAQERLFERIGHR